MRTVIRSVIAAGLVIVTASPGLSTSAADLVITGRVMSSAGQPLFGAGVDIEAAGVRVGTNERGEYVLPLRAQLRGDRVVVRARLFGYAPQTRLVSLTADTTVVNFILSADVNRLSQVVVTGAAAAGRARLPFKVAQSPISRTDGVELVRADSATRVRDLSGEQYARIVDNPFRAPSVAPLSTFGVDVDRAAYANVRRIITVDRQRPPADAVRIEEFVNYFNYQYAPPTGEHPFAVHTEVSAAPWAPEHLLVRIGLQARTLDLTTAPANNLVFLIDVSGSMQGPDKLPLLTHALGMLVEQLRAQDRVAIVVYAGSEGLALPSTPGAEKQKMFDVLDRLHAGGSTAGGAGLRLAYDVVKANFIAGGNNRVILATDGDFNVGVTSNAELERMIEQRREEGAALTVLGFGAGNINDDRMEMLANKGNGNYAYIDSPLEARKVLVQEMGGTLVTVAKDVKLQVEFNPSVVAAYRLIGYENRLLADEDFKDDTKDSGDMGAGHSVTALYEIVPVGAADASIAPSAEPRRYTTPAAVDAGDATELMYIRLRYKQPTGAQSVELAHAVPNRVVEPSYDFRFAQAVAAFGMILRDSEYRGSATPASVLRLARGAIGADPWGYRADFVRLVSAYEELPQNRVSKRGRSRD